MKYAFAVFFLITNIYSIDYQELQVEGKIDEDLDVSAITCIDKDRCLIVSDETTHVQLAKIRNDKLIVDERKVSLGSFKKENDLEGATHDGKYFYIIGSHGLSKKDKLQSSRYKVFRLLIDSKNKVKELGASSLGKILKQTELKKYYKKSLKKNGLNIEGLAYHDGFLFIGFRSPVIDGKAQILKISSDAIFKEKRSQKTDLIQLDLGDERGVRSLEVKNNKLYILAGDSKVSDDLERSLFLFSYPAIELIKDIEIPYAHLKAEGIEILNESEILYVYDSENNGMPIIQNL